MALKQITDGLWIISGFVNMYLIDLPEGMALVDTGFPKSEGKVFDALRSLGRKPADLKHILLTHAHSDHIGSAGVLQQQTGARTYIHATDAPIAQAGTGFRPLTGDGALLPTAILRFIVKPDEKVTPTRIDERLTDNQVLPLDGGIDVIPVPGHCAGQVAYLWRRRRVLFAADTCVNLLGLRPPIGYEDRATAEASQRKLAGLSFDIACFGHGGPIVGNAATKFREKWG